MAAASGRSSADLSLREEMEEKPGAFDFAQVVRILRETDPLGRRKLPADDPDEDFVRFRSSVSLTFPGSDVADIEFSEDGLAEVSVAFMGLGTGHTLGSLPTAYIQLLMDEVRDHRGGSPLIDFLDLFNHRLVSLYFGALEKHDPILQIESGHRLFERVLGSIAGLGTPDLVEQLELDPRALLARAGLIAMSPMPALALERMLESFFEVPVEIEQFLPAWFDVSQEDQSRLGRTNCILGESAFLGRSVELFQSKFRVVLGPLSWERYRRFFPDSPAHRELLGLLQVAAPPDQEFEIDKRIEVEERPPLVLQREASDAGRLGWSTWLGNAPPSAFVDGPSPPPPPFFAEPEPEPEPDPEPTTIFPDRIDMPIHLPVLQEP